ncbi:MAG: hypothetical protein OEM97_00170 [Acidimicrobiia bacterium]|nr:hypothetical protein [Acidimicrobiia bacterium]
MSEFVAAVSEKLSGAPEELVVRSATARAAALGVSVDEVLAAWAGDGAAPAAPAPAPATADTPAASAEPESPAAPVEAVPAEPAAVAAAVAATVPAGAVIVEEDEEDTVEPAPLRERLRRGVGVGAVMGAMLGVVGIVLSSPLIIERADVVGDAGESAISVTALTAVLTIAVVSGVFGAIIAVAARAIPRFISRAFATRGGSKAAAIMGAIVGVILGFVAGGILVATGEEGLDGGVLLSVRSGLTVVLLGGAVLGAVTGGAIQALGTSALHEDDAEKEVRDRISNAMMVPSLAAIGILGFVVPLGVLLVTFHELAPLIALVVAGLILTFSFLMASHPNLRISRGEFLLAVAGVGVALVLIAAIASQLASGGEGEGGHGEESAAVRLLTV